MFSGKLITVIGTCKIDVYGMSIILIRRDARVFRHLLVLLNITFW